MKRLFTILFAALTLSSCVPEAYSFLYDMRYPGQAGFVLGNKTLSVVYLNNGIQADSLYLSNLALGFAQGLEKVYFQDSVAIPIFSLDKDMTGQYASKDTLVNLILDTDSDIVFLFDSPSKIDDGNTVKEKSYLYTYDSMDKQRDSVVAIYLEHNIAANDKNFASAVDYGTRVSSLFSDVLKKEFYSFIYYTDSDRWINALYHATNQEWIEAIEIWMRIVSSTTNPEKQACAAYNIAAAFYLIDEYDLAEEWLDASEEFYKIDNSGSLRTRIRQMRGEAL